jgi:hypothetical protein
MVEFGFLASCLTTHHGSIPFFYPFAMSLYRWRGDTEITKKAVK